MIPTDDLTVQLGTGKPMAIPLASLRRGGASAETSTWQYRAPGNAAVSAFVLKNTRRQFTLRIGAMAAVGMGLPLGNSVGTRRDVALQIDIPPAQGRIVFLTTPELVRTAGRDRWKRPAPLLR